MIKKSFTVAMLIVGTIIGAGFCSGKEISSYFAAQGFNVFVPIVCAILVAVISYYVISVGNKIGAKDISQFHYKIFGKFSIVADIILLCNSAITMSSMLAGFNSLGSIVLPIAPVYSFSFGLIAVIVIMKGNKGLLKISAIIVPIIIIAIIIMFFTNSSGANVPLFGQPIMSLMTTLVYVSMNMLLASSVITTISGLTKKVILMASVIAGVCVGALVAIIMYIMSANPSSIDSSMPLLWVAQSNKILFAIMFVAIGVAIFTTLLSAMTGLVNWLDTIVHDRLISSLAVLTTGVLLSLVGFDFIVAVLYPIIGVIGLVYLALLVFCVQYNKRNHSLLRINKLAAATKSLLKG